jgi:hypothetical protein
MKRIATFEAFTYNESAEAGKEVLIFDHDQFEDFTQAINNVGKIQIMWDLTDERYWDRYVTPGKKFALIHTGKGQDGKELIGAVLDADGYAEMAYYNNDTKCSLEEADGHIQSMNMFTKENMEWEMETCGNCGCDCDKCECDECDCSSNDWKDSEEDMKLEYYRYDASLTDKLVQAVKEEDEEEIEALLLAGADMSPRRFRVLRVAMDTGNVDIVNMLFDEVDEDELTAEHLDEIEEHGESCSDEVRDLVLSKVEDMKHSMMTEKKKTSYKKYSYKKSGLKNPKKADLNKDRKISGYEKARGKAIQKSVQAEKEEKGSKGLSAKQKKLPEGLRKAIEARMKKKK